MVEYCSAAAGKDKRLNNYIYLREPGILYDMMFALKLRFNGERAYLPFTENSPSKSEDTAFYQLIISKLENISSKLLPFFYWNDSPKIYTAMLAFVRDYWEELHYTDSDLIENFYNSLRDIPRLKKYLYENYIPDSCLDIIDITTFEHIRNDLYKCDIPDDVKLYLIDFLLYGENEIEFIISELRKVQSLCEELYQINIHEVNDLIAKFDNLRLETISQMHAADVSKYDMIYYSYCVIYRCSVYGEVHQNAWISILGIRSEAFLHNFDPNVEIDLYELGRILYDETRLKILKLLFLKPMYCAEIAKKLGLKNNSTSYHLVMMEAQKLIVNKKQGKKIIYSLNSNYLISVRKLIDDLTLNT